MLSSQVAKQFIPAEDRDMPDPYPWLDADDPRRNMTDEEILENAIDDQHVVTMSACYKNN